MQRFLILLKLRSVISTLFVGILLITFLVTSHVVSASIKKRPSSLPFRLANTPVLSWTKAEGHTLTEAVTITLAAGGFSSSEETPESFQAIHWLYLPLIQEQSNVVVTAISDIDRIFLPYVVSDNLTQMEWEKGAKQAQSGNEQNQITELEVHSDFVIESAEYTSKAIQYILLLPEERNISTDLAAAVTQAGGKLITTVDQIGVAVATTDNLDFPNLIVQHRNVLAVTEDLYFQWFPDEWIAGNRVPIAHDESVHANSVLNESRDPSQAEFFKWQWNMRAVEADKAWAAGFRGDPSVSVAILDSGIDYMHIDFTGKVDEGRSTSFVGELPATPQCYDQSVIDSFFPGAPAWVDLGGHGTWVAGVVAAQGYGISGVAPNVQLLAVKIANLCGWTTTSWTIQGLVYAADHGADIINISYGAPIPRSCRFDEIERRELKSQCAIIRTAEQRAIAYADRHGALVVGSAGNESIDADQDQDSFIAYAQFPAVIGVSATGPTYAYPGYPPYLPPRFEGVDTPATYTNFGRSLIAVAAPGGDSVRSGNNVGSIIGPCSHFSVMWPICGSGDFYLFADGTSAAAPHVAGVAALVDSMWKGQLTGAQLRAVVEQTADDLGEPGTDPYFGQGRVNAFRAVAEGRFANPKAEIVSYLNTKLMASDWKPSQLFGADVALSGDTALIGAYDDDGGNIDQGAVYVFVRDRKGWIQQTKISAPFSAESPPYNWSFFHSFGSLVALAGNTAAVVAPPGADTLSMSNSESVYVYVRTGGIWTKAARLIPYDSDPEVKHISSLAISENTILVGARWDGNGGFSKGSVYVFVYDGIQWLQQAKLMANDAQNFDMFGWSVAMEGNIAVVGARNARSGSDPWSPATGAAYVFVRDGTMWSQQAKLIPGDLSHEDYAGVAVAISGHTILIGANGYEPPRTNFLTDSGASYVFVYDGTQWLQQAKLTAQDADFSDDPNSIYETTGDRFGTSVVLSGDTALISTFGQRNGTAGAVYFFERSGSSWFQKTKLAIPTDAPPNDRVWLLLRPWPVRIALQEDTALIGAPGNDDGAANAGAVFLATKEHVKKDWR